MLYISISVTLFALMGGILLLSKSKTDAMGAFAKWMAYFVILVSLGMLVCEFGRACTQMMHCKEAGMSEHHMMNGCPPEMCGGMQCCMPMGHGCCMMGGKMDGDKKCCDEEMEHGKGECHDMEEGEHGGHMKMDSTAKK